jgi:threonine aldolase
MIDRLVEDHTRAKALADGLRGLPGVILENDPPPTNMIYMRLTNRAVMDGPSLADDLARKKIRINPGGGNRIRLVTHYWIDDEAVESTINAFEAALGKSV